ncbi:MAG TPA: hypothetical protein VFL57_14700 [Bryobacteraceae bacterium]|nr:hypothetical protein [Bryobacteraceae bacterium]
MLASVAAVAAAVSAMTCCLPVLPLALAATSAAASAILTSLRPWLLVFSVLLIAYGFFEGRRGKRCRGSHLAASVLLWISAAIVAVVLLAPDLLADLAAR